jgi:galactose-1-phosphate uridylyltransferase
VESGHGVTAANVSRYDSLNSLVIFSERDPLAFTPESLQAHFSLALEWFKKAHAWDAAASYPYVLWNCLWRAGGSVAHGHLQVTLARNTHYARIERLRADAGRYLSENGASYFDDLFSVHRALGCGLTVGDSRVLAHLTPVREKEVVVLAQRLDAASLRVLHDVLAAFRDRMGVRSFNVGIALPPMAPVEEPWDDFPVMMRIVDRGDLGNRTSDVGGMELFAESVVASDPFAVAAELRDAMGVS